MHLPDDASARALVANSVCSKAIYELWASASTYEKLHADIQQGTSSRWPLYHSCSFRFDVDSFLGSRSAASQRELIDSFRYLGFQGPIKMRDPEQIFAILEEYASAPDSGVCRVHFGRYVASSQRNVLQRYSLKTRRYINTTSMDSELAFLTANITRAGPGKMFYDPFVGTGSFPIACAHFGAVCIGSDIDGRMLRGKEQGRNIMGNFHQYKMPSRWLDGFAADLTNSPLRTNSRWLDGIVCDPPYGIREGLKVLGMKDDANGKPRGRDVVFLDGRPSFL